MHTSCNNKYNDINKLIITIFITRKVLRIMYIIIPQQIKKREFKHIKYYNSMSIISTHTCLRIYVYI